MLVSNSAVLTQPWDGKGLRGANLADLKQREELRSCIRYVLGISTFSDLTVELSHLADKIMENVLLEQMEKKKVRRAPLAVFALGKYGTRELSLDADLDVIIVADLNSKSATDTLERIASAAIQVLSSVDERGRLYEVDARLRPEGRNAPLVVDRKAYATYLSERASLWERQSLTRLRFVCGDHTLANEVEGDVASFVYERPLPKTWTEQIVAMRRKMETRSQTRSSGFLDVKLGPGGMVDVEFIVQMIQLKYGAALPLLRNRLTTEVLESSPAAVLSGSQVTLLQSAYQLFRRVEIMMRLVHEDRSTILPEGEKLILLARILGLPDGEALTEQIAEAATNVRGQFLQTAKALSSN